MPPATNDVELISSPPASIADAIGGILATFSEKDDTAKQNLEHILSSGASAFSRASVSVLATPLSDEAARYLTQILWRQRLLLEDLVNPQRSRTREAIAGLRAQTR